MRILTVGNHVAMLRELGKELSEIFPEGEIIWETDALRAGKYAFNHDVDMVFAETNMKRMNGVEFIQFVRQEHPDVKSFIVGTEQELSESFLIISEDVDGILNYPFEENAIRKALQGIGQ